MILNIVLWYWNWFVVLNGVYGGIRFNLDIMIMVLDVFKLGLDVGLVGIRCWYILIRCWFSGIILLI